MREAMHLIADIDCQGGLSDASVIESFMRHVIQLTGLTIRHFHIQEFSNGSEFGPGVTGMALLSESHIVVHTAPERQTMNLDLFSCRPFDAERLEHQVQLFFGPASRKRWEILER
tara:strand:+ start:1860 stop:2204 length:345 start_codon:yes stop_codon:yes gene_type:complete